MALPWDKNKGEVVEVNEYGFPIVGELQQGTVDENAVAVQATVQGDDNASAGTPYDLEKLGFC